VTARADRHLPTAIPCQPNTLENVVLGFRDQHRGRIALGTASVEDAREAGLVVSVGPAKDQAIIRHVLGSRSPIDQVLASSEQGSRYRCEFVAAQIDDQYVEESQQDGRR
jgi:hypothetical protein